MMASHQIELDKAIDDIVRKININGTENQNFTIDIPCDFTEADLRYIEKEVERRI
jgi:hypothetical protein